MFIKAVVPRTLIEDGEELAWLIFCFLVGRFGAMMASALLF